MTRRTIAVTAVTLSLVLGGCTIVVQSPPATSPSASVTSTPSPTGTTSASPTPSPTEPSPTLGPQGFGDLALGMTKVQVRATGLTSGVVGRKGRCGGPSDGRLTGADVGDDLSGRLFFSLRTNRLVIIGATKRLTTPEGVRLGTTMPTVRAAYPAWKGYRRDAYGVGYVQAPGNADAYYRIAVRDGKVVELTLQSLDQDCTE